jgi:ABC-2 type transport system permease protein
MIIDNFLNEYVKCISAYQTAGLSAADAAEKAAESLSDGINVTIENFSDNESGSFTESYQFFFQFFAYIIICVFMNTVCPVLLKLNRSDLKKRVNSSCVPQFSQALQTMLGSAVVFAGIWVILVIAGTIIGGGSFSTMNMLAIVNSFVFALVAAGITLLCSVLIKEPKIINVVTNILGLGMSFLCGVFVPQMLLSDTVLNVGKFLPAYWYVKANNMLSGSNNEIFSNSKFFICIGIEIAFSVMLFCITILAAKTKRSSKSV